MSPFLLFLVSLPARAPPRQKPLHALHDLRADVSLFAPIIGSHSSLSTGIADIEANTAKELTKLGGVIQVPFRSGNVSCFLPVSAYCQIKAAG